MFSSPLRAWAEKDGRGYPDWAMRYVPIVKRLGRDALTRGAVLEIGANENGLSRFAGVPVIAVDIEHEHLKACRDTQQISPVVADITALPFRDDTFSVCVSVDTFEHIPESMRDAAVGEMARVSDTEVTVVVTFPSGQASVAAERAVRDRYHALTGNTIKWLEEHDEVGLPCADRMKARFSNLLGTTHTVATEGNVPLWIWKWMWLVMMCNWPGRGNAFFQVMLRLMTPVLGRIKLGKCYRTMIWVEPER
jgi:Methyltransferase domain